MSTSHIYVDACDRPTRAPWHTLSVTIRSLAAIAEASAARLLAALQRRLAMQRIGRMADHQLRDIGFERDWDGSVVRGDWQS